MNAVCLAVTAKLAELAASAVETHCIGEETSSEKCPKTAKLNAEGGTGAGAVDSGNDGPPARAAFDAVFEAVSAIVRATPPATVRILRPELLSAPRQVKSYSPGEHEGSAQRKPQGPQRIGRDNGEHDFGST